MRSSGGSGCPGPYVISVGLKVVKKVRVESARGVVNLIWRQWRLNCALSPPWCSSQVVFVHERVVRS